MLARKPRMLVISALANKMARMAWALLTRNEVYRAPAVIAAQKQHCGVRLSKE